MVFYGNVAIYLRISWFSKKTEVGRPKTEVNSSGSPPEELGVGCFARSREHGAGSWEQRPQDCKTARPQDN